MSRDVSPNYAAMSREELIAAYQRGPADLRNAVEGMPTEQLGIRIGPGKWSILEVICHIADSEVIYAERIRRVLAEHEPTLFNLEPDDFEQALVYDLRDPAEELTLIETIRNQTARILRNQSSEAWERRGLHSTDGPLSIRKLMERVTNHIPHHIAFITDKRTAMSGQR